MKAAAKLEEIADRCEKVAEQIKKRVAGEAITGRIVSLADPDARPRSARAFSILYRRLLEHAIFTSEDDLATKRLAYIETAKPFKWTYTGEVLEA